MLWTACFNRRMLAPSTVSFVHIVRRRITFLGHESNQYHGCEVPSMHCLDVVEARKDGSRGSAE